MTDDSWAPPGNTDAPKSTAAPMSVVIPLGACALLGGIGILMTCYSGVAVGWSQLGTVPGINPEQAQMLEEIRAQQPWWTIPLTVVQLLAKMALSFGLLAGSVQVLRRQFAGLNILLPVLVFGIVYELASSLLGAGYTLLNWDQMAQQFTAQMAADPNIPPEMAAGAGAAFGMTMAVTMVGMVFWAVVKAGLYGWTRFKLQSPDTERWRGTFD